MKLKQAIVGTLKSEALREVADQLEVTLPDRRSVEAMRHTLSRSRKSTAEAILELLRKDELVAICQELDVAKTGNKPDLIGRILERDKGKGNGIVTQDETPLFDGDGQAEEPAETKPKKGRQN